MHSERHVLLYGTNPLSRLKLDNGKLAGRGPMAPGAPVPLQAHSAHPFRLPHPSSVQPVPLASWTPPTTPRPFVRYLHLALCTSPAAFSGPPCSWPGQRLRGFSSHTHGASVHRAPGTEDVCDAVLWWSWGKCAPGSRAYIATGSWISSLCSARLSPCLLVLVVLPDLAGQGLSHNAPLPARSSLWTGVSLAHQCLQSVEPCASHLEGVW